MLNNAQFIGVKERANVFVLKKEFNLDRVERANLSATALGVYFATINGKRVGDARLAPGWTAYSKMLQVQTYDVTDLLKVGKNVIEISVGEGWYCSGMSAFRYKYGEQSAVCAELTVGDNLLSTDQTWSACESFIRFSGIYDGEIVDLSADRNSLTPINIYYDKNLLVEQICEPVRDIERVGVKDIIITPAGERVYDFGQNLVGVVEIITPDDFDGTITMQFAEILVDGNFYTENLRGAKATDKFSAKGKHTFTAEFTFHGFRYMKIEGVQLPADNVTAIVRHTDMNRTGYVRTGNIRFDKFLSNVVWGQRCNFLDLPTDCPQRDERLGWTGDINAFCRTAAYNYDVRLILKKWLTDLRNEQAETGDIPVVSPDVLGTSATSAMWCDAIVMVPWTLYEMYGDKTFLSDNYEAMKKFLSAREDRVSNGLVGDGWEFGDWLAMDLEPLIDSPIGRTDVKFIVNAFYVASLDIVIKTAAILGNTCDAEKYRVRHKKLLKDMRAEYFTPSGRLAIDTVTAQVLALQFNIVEDKFRSKLAFELGENVKKHNYLVSTGFIGTAYLLFALADNGYFEVARRLLLNNGCPGWLYEVDMGATTVWERWNSLTFDKHPNPDEMNSYNHYAFGAAAEFVYRRIAGIDSGAPGFEKIIVSPMPTKGMPNVRAEYNSVKGKIVSSYESKDNIISYYVELPEGVCAEIKLPGEPSLHVNGGVYTFERKCEDLLCKAFTKDSIVAEVMYNPVALAIFDKFFGGIFSSKKYSKDISSMTLNEVAIFLEKQGVFNSSMLDSLLEQANQKFENRQF